jgi:DNA topoisomerase-1
MAKNLVIVESPATKTIEKFLGSDFQVESSYGHIADLFKEIGVDVEHGFKPNMKYLLIKALVKLKAL